LLVVFLKLLRSPSRFLRRLRGPTLRRLGLAGRSWPKPSARDRKSTRLNSSHGSISYAVFCLKKKKDQIKMQTKKIGLVIHGNAGTIERSKMTQERERAYRDELQRARAPSYEIQQQLTANSYA